jgi:hypothetical protein
VKNKVRCLGHILGVDCWRMIPAGQFFCDGPDGCWPVWDRKYAAPVRQPELPLEGQQAELWLEVAR